MRLESERDTAMSVSPARGALALVASCLTIALLASAAAAQQPNTVARMVATAPDGDLTIEYATRAGVCGDGAGSVNVRHGATRLGYVTRDGDDRCEAGPARATLTVRSHQVERVRVTVGGRASAARAVPARDASAYLLSIVPSLEPGSRETVSRALLAAVLADSSDIVPSLLAMAKDASRLSDTRGQSLFWSGVLGDSTVIAPIVAIAQDAGAPRRVRDQAVFAVSQRDDEPGFQALMQLAQDGRDPAMQRKALFWLGQKDDPRATALLSKLILR